MPKRGRMTDAERQFIRDNMGIFSTEEMAKRLNRTKPSIERWMNETKDLTTPVEIKFVAESNSRSIKDSRAWQLLKAEFSAEEIAYFMERWEELVEQFREDVVPSEKAQLMMVIKLEILISRTMQDIQNARVISEHLTAEMEDFFHEHGRDKRQWDEDVKSLFYDLEDRLNKARLAITAKTKELDQPQGRHESLMKALKATREQRISKIESKGSFLDLIKRLQIEGEREKEGRAMELMRVAAEKETKRLGSVHTYLDGVSDQPLLNADTLEMIDVGKENDEVP